MNSRTLYLLSLSVFLSSSVATAQLDDKDAFGDIDDPEDEQTQQFGSAPDGQYNAQQAGGAQAFGSAPAANTATAETLMGGGAFDSSSMNQTNSLKSMKPKWGDLNQLGGERIEDTYEMQIKDELAKPMPKRNPFGNRMEEMEQRLKPKTESN